MKLFNRHYIIDEAQLDMLPVMNLFSILIPFLVTIVVFQKMAVVDVNLPETSDQAKGGTVTTSSLSLVISISEQNLNVHSSTGSLPPIALAEYWSVKCKKDLNTIDYLAEDIRSNRKEFLCANGQKANKHDIAEIHLYSIKNSNEEQGLISATDPKATAPSAYDELEKLLRDIASRYADADDISDITVVASDEIAFDKIIQVMDRARESGFTNISLAKLGI